MANNNLKRNVSAYGYKYTDLAQIHEYLESQEMKYIQYIERIDGDDYIMTKRYIDGKWEEQALMGCRIVQAVLQGQGKNNPAQEQGSALTYARRYSLLMAFGLATEDDDAQSLNKTNQQNNYKNYNKVISDDRAEAFQNWCDSLFITEEQLNNKLKKYGYASIYDIKEKDLKPITEELKKEC